MNKYQLSTLVYISLIILGSMLMIKLAPAHEHKPGETSEAAQVTEFLRTWTRPKGDFGVVHRQSSCCYISGSLQDCFAVARTRRVDGHLEVFPETDNVGYQNWYRVDDHGIEEHKQPDPRESPDGRSYVCIAGVTAVCYVAGYGG